jgi:hypothetical protein
MVSGTQRVCTLKMSPQVAQNCDGEEFLFLKSMLKEESLKILTLFLRLGLTTGKERPMEHTR